MNCEFLNAEMIAKMFLAGAHNLEAKKEWINELNVFPVPDGDTGTNMTMTILAAANEVAAMENPTMQDLSKAIASGTLRGARGNSGVILSQLFRGLTKGFQNHNEITVPVLADSFTKAVETAYKAVMKPKEGTILTVAKGVAEKASLLKEEGVTDLKVFMDEVISHADYVLSQTPEMLPVLKQAGVVDSGGQGLVEVMKGAYDAFLGKEIDFHAIVPEKKINIADSAAVQAEADIKFGYCTEFIIMTQSYIGQSKEAELKAYLESIGDSLVVVADEEVVKVHVHTNDPGLAIQKALTYGALSNMKIDNMRLEHQEKLFQMSGKNEAGKQEPEKMEHKEVGFLAVSVGDGMNRVFKDLGADYIIEGGQTMNPSTQDMLNAIGKVNADTIFILPNNKNIILAANQAKELTKDKNIVVIPTRTVPQGITAIISFLPDLSVAENESTMLEEITRVKTGQITYAVRDTSIGGKEIHQGDFMGIGDEGIVAVNENMEAAVMETIAHLVDDDVELLSIYYGMDVEEEEAERLKERVQSKYKDLDIELQFGGQPVYYYMLSAE